MLNKSISESHIPAQSDYASNPILRHDERCFESSCCYNLQRKYGIDDIDTSFVQINNIFIDEI